MEQETNSFLDWSKVLNIDSLADPATFKSLTEIRMAQFDQGTAVTVKEHYDSILKNCEKQSSTFGLQM